jgi:glycosyltransferase involved in cell wall biosynthesis
MDQDYDNFKVVVVDDCSDDNTWDLIQGFDVVCRRNKERLGSALGNIAWGINLISKDKDDIIVTVDGDDYLVDNSVLSYLNEIYQEDVWLTYGSFLPLSGRYKGTCQDLKETHTFDDEGRPITNYPTPVTYRKSGVWVTSHLRTFKRGLWDMIDDKDLRDENGEYFKIAGDLAYMYPLVEMAGHRTRFIDKVLYMYNDLNPNCDSKTNPQEQIRTGKLIQLKPCYNFTDKWNQ